MFVSSACMEAHTHTYSHTLTILGRGPDPQCPRFTLDRVYKSALYTLHTYTLRVSALSVCVCVCVSLNVRVCVHARALVCVCVCSQASRSRATLSCDSSYFSYWQGTIQASYAVMRQLLLKIVRGFDFEGLSFCFIVKQTMPNYT